MEKGRVFRDWDDVEEVVRKYGEEKKVVFVRVDSMSIRVAQKRYPRCSLPEELKYFMIKFGCKHFGSYDSKSAGIRPNQRTHKLGCPAFVRVVVNRRTKQPEVVACDFEHNHLISKTVYDHYPEVRRSVRKKLGVVDKSIGLGVTVQTLKNYVESNSNKCIALNDIHTIRTTNSYTDASEEDNLMAACEKLLSADPQATITFYINEASILMGLLYQSSEMKAITSRFSDCLQIGCTDPINNRNMRLYSVIAEDGDGCTCVAAQCLLAGETKEAIRFFLNGFCDLNPCAKEMNRVWVIDRQKFDVISQLFPTSQIVLYKKHVLGELMKEWKNHVPATEDLGSANHASARACLKRIVDASSAEVYDSELEFLRTVVPVSFVEYYLRVWDSCKENWVNCFVKYFPTFDNTTTNRSESYHKRLKEFLGPNMSVVECVLAVMQFNSDVKNKGREECIKMVTRPCGPTVSQEVVVGSDDVGEVSRKLSRTEKYNEINSVCAQLASIAAELPDEQFECVLGRVQAILTDLQVPESAELPSPVLEGDTTDELLVQRSVASTELVNCSLPRHDVLDESSFSVRLATCHCQQMMFQCLNCHRRHEYRQSMGDSVLLSVKRRKIVN